MIAPESSVLRAELSVPSWRQVGLPSANRPSCSTRYTRTAIVTWVSPTAAEVRFARAALLDPFVMVEGMKGSAHVITGKRTLAQYALEPLKTTGGERLRSLEELCTQPSRILDEESPPIQPVDFAASGLASLASRFVLCWYRRLTMPRKLGPKRFIAVAGNMGVGKTTLVEFLCHHYGIEPYFEPNETNPYLEDFYGDMKRWSFHSQLYFLSMKFRIHQELTSSRKAVLQDRTIYEDAEIFAENLYRQRKMTKRDYLTYRSLYEAIIKELRPPNLMIYLRCGMRTLRKRIRMRGRPEEQAIPRSYLIRLQELYEEWFAQYELSETLIIDTDRLDYIQDLVDQISLFEKIESALKVKR